VIGATLCSGIRAPECAAPWIDWRWHAEIEAFPAAVHAARFPHSVNLGDMTAPDFVERAAAIALPDVIVAGTPCQAFSVAGPRGSLADARGNLTLLFIRICDAIDDLRRAAGLAPLWIVWENVPGVFSTSDNAFGSFVAGLVGGDAALEPPRGRGWTDAGVVSGPERCAAWRILDAQHFGLAQRRRRVFVVARGGSGNWAGADALLPVIESLHWHPAPRRGAGQRAARPIAAGSESSSGYRNDADTADNLIAGTVRATDGGADVDHARGGHLTTVGTMPAAGGTKRKHGQGWGQQEWEAGYAIPLGLGDDGQLARALNGCKTAAGRHDVSVDTYVAHTLRGEGFDATEDGSGRGTPLVPVLADPVCANEARTYTHERKNNFRLRNVVPSPVAFTQNSRSEVRHIGGDGAVTGAVTAEPGAQQQTYVAFSAKDHGADAGEIAPTMRSMGFDGSHANGGGQIGVATTSAVRRLTPRECERLQGFPDDWTLIQISRRQPIEGQPNVVKMAADGPRYKVLGNSMAVPVMRYLLERVRAVS
jgi:DNA (cytosine-5)-methyltransferase 1